MHFIELLRNPAGLFFRDLSTRTQSGIDLNTELSLGAADNLDAPGE